MKVIGPQINKWQQYRNIILLLVAVIAMVLIGSFVIEIKNKNAMYIGIFAYAAIFVTFLLRMLAEKVTLNPDKKVVIINSYNIFTQKEVVIPYEDLQFEFYTNRFASKGKGGLIFYQKEQFKFYLTLNQPGWTQELIQEVLTALREEKLKEKAEANKK